METPTTNNEPVVTKVEVGTLMGHPALILHYVGDADQFPYEIGDSARALVKKVWPDEEHDFEPHQTPVGAEVCIEQPGESGQMVSIALDDAIKFGVRVSMTDGKLELEY
jgi:hypothetical protein